MCVFDPRVNAMHDDFLGRRAKENYIHRFYVEKTQMACPFKFVLQYSDEPIVCDSLMFDFSVDLYCRNMDIINNTCPFFATYVALNHTNSLFLRYIYIILLDREIDSDGWLTYSRILDKSIDRLDVIRAILYSSEFSSKSSRHNRFKGLRQFVFSNIPFYNLGFWISLFRNMKGIVLFCKLVTRRKTTKNQFFDYYKFNYL
jgi:hypothetical protein